jgi:hypothetical protein
MAGVGRPKRRSRKNIYRVNMYTYFVQSSSGGNIKIGRTTRDPRWRIRQLQTGSQERLRLIGLLEGDRERELHDRFSDYLVHGEWFKPCCLLRDFIINECQSLPIFAQINPSPEKINSDTPSINDSIIPITRRFDLDYLLGDIVYENDDDLIDKLQPLIQDELETTGEEFDDDEDDYSSPWEELLMLVNEESFVTKVAVNSERELIVVICGELNSGRKLEFLQNLASFAWDIQCDTNWAFMAVYTEYGKVIAIDLESLFQFEDTKLYAMPTEAMIDPKEEKNYEGVAALQA